MSPMFPRSSHPHPFDLAPIAREIWQRKYRFTAPDGAPVDQTIDETFVRVARAAASAEPEVDRERWAQQFHAAMSDFGFLPAGRILAGAGTGRAVTLFNCFVLGRIEDDLSAIFDAVKDAALTMQQGGGIGHDFSTLRPSGALVHSVGAGASGPVSFMDVWDAMCRTIMSAGARRGAMMGTLRCDHPDIEAFIDAKSDPRRLRNFNVSVLVTDRFIEAVRADAPWDLVFEGRVYRTVAARALWDRLMQATYDTAEPGVIFIDRVNAANNLAYCETIAATNPCGEQPLPPFGACLLGSINLARLVTAPLTTDARLDLAALDARVQIAVRLLDNIIDVSGYPLAAQRAEALAKRRIGLGVTGLADALALLGVRYGSPDACELASTWMARITRAAYLTSSSLAAEKGAFPAYDREAMLARPFVARLDADVREEIGRTGLRNGCLTSIAPTGTISLIAGNVSSGIEPIFAESYTRRVLEPDGSHREEVVEDYAVALRRHLAPQVPPRGDAAATAPQADAFVTAEQLQPREHLEMLAAVQPHVDSSISKTINCPADLPFEAFKSIYLDAYDLGLKGCTTYRPNDTTGAVLSPNRDPIAAAGPVATGHDASREPPKRMQRSAGRPAPDPAHAVVYMAEPLARDEALGGMTYKLKWPGSDHALYITINDIERDGRRRPFEIFINTKNLDHYAWTVALTRMISAVFRRGGDVTFVVEELKAIFDPQGGRWIDGTYVPSLLAAIGGVIEQHMLRTGFLTAPLRLTAEAATMFSTDSDAAKESQIATTGSASGREARFDVPARGRACPRCGQSRLMRVGGCWVCDACGHSSCG